MSKELGSVFHKRSDRSNVGHACGRVVWPVNPDPQQIRRNSGWAVWTVRRNVHAVTLKQITPHILPEVDELQCCACRIAHGIAISIGGVDFRWGVSPKREDDSANGIGAALAIVQQLLPCVVACDALVLHERIDEIGKGLSREMRKLLARSSKSDKHRVTHGYCARPIVETRKQFTPPPPEQSLAQGPSFRGMAGFVAQIISPAAKGIDSGEIIAQIIRHERREHTEVLVVRGRQVAAIGIGLFDCGDRRPLVNRGIRTKSRQ